MTSRQRMDRLHHRIVRDRYVLHALPERFAWGRDRRSHAPRRSGALAVGRRGPPEATRARYHALKQQRDAVTVIPEQHAELIRLVNEGEDENVRRLEAVAELAKQRGARFAELGRELGLSPPSGASVARSLHLD